MIIAFLGIFVYGLLAALPGVILPTLNAISFCQVKHIRRKELIAQQEGMRVEIFRGKLFDVDIDGAVFVDRWSTFPIFLRLQLFI
jgi:hypothetical protein